MQWLVILYSCRVESKETHPFGVACHDVEALWQRMLISDLRLLDPKEAQTQGCGKREVIVPGDIFRLLTEQELDAILVPPNTLNAIKYVKLPASIGERAVAIDQSPSYKLDPQSAPIDFGEGVTGHVGGSRYDEADLVNVSKDDDDLFVGSHIDNFRSDPGKRIAAVLNLGPGKRWHYVAPSFTLSVLGAGPGPASRNAYMRQRIERGEEVLAYWFGIEPPYHDPDTNETVLDALVNSPVATCLHEGSTLGSRQGSHVVFIVAITGEDTWRSFAPSV